MPEPVSIIVATKVAFWAAPTIYRAYRWAAGPAKRAGSTKSTVPPDVIIVPPNAGRVKPRDPETLTSSEDYLRRAREMVGRAQPSGSTETAPPSLKEILSGSGVKIIDRRLDHIFQPDPHNPAPEGPTLRGSKSLKPTIDAMVTVGHRGGFISVEMELEHVIVVASVTVNEADEMGNTLKRDAKIQRDGGGM